MKPEDADLLARYQNYAKSSINNKLNGFDDPEATLEKSESYLTKALQREILKLTSDKKLSEQEALERILS